MNKKLSSLVRLLVVCALSVGLWGMQPSAVRSGPVSELVAQAMALHKQASYLTLNQNLAQALPVWQSQYEALSAQISATLPYANNGEFAAPIQGPLQATGTTTSCAGAPCDLNLTVETGALVLSYYQSLLAQDLAMLQTLLNLQTQSTASTPQ